MMMNVNLSGGDETTRGRGRHCFGRMGMMGEFVAPVIIT